MAEHESKKGYTQFHRRVLEGNAAVFAIVATVAIMIGGVVELVPMFTASYGPERADWVTPYTPLEVAGRDIYIREGCYLCHSQMVRPMRAEILRYGEWTRAPEYMYDHPQIPRRLALRTHARPQEHLARERDAPLRVAPAVLHRSR